MKLEFVAIPKDGEYESPETDAPTAVADVVGAMTALYGVSGYEPPWIGYLIKENGRFVGTCGFKSPPQYDRVEIAYFTFPEHESRGIATEMAAELIRMALDARPDVTIAAQTLPKESASTAILKKLNFAFVETVDHPEDGLVWEWQLRQV
ncbi:MAG: GNAT family N-acetyltransferase [Pyrinomonadaceae bacterium]